MFPKPERRSKGRRRVSEDDREVYRRVMARDGGCVASRVDPTIDPCSGVLQRDHVRPGGGAMGMARVTRVDAVVILCAHHHLDGWATGHRADLREYLRSVAE